MARRRGGAIGWGVLVVVGIAALNGVNHNSVSPTAVPSSRTPVPPYTSVLPPKDALPTEVSDKPVPLVTPGTVTRPKVLYVSASSLNVRSSPSSSGALLLKVPLGTAVVAISQRDGWVEVRLNKGTTGWMIAQYLSEHTAPEIADLEPAPPSSPPPKPSARSYDRTAVVSAIIAASLSQYPGACPCPYNTMRNGRACGGRSAYSKPGGYAPLCYPQDVSQAMIDDYVASR